MRSIATSGIVFRSTDCATPPLYGLLTTRFPSSSTSVRPSPRLRRLANEAPPFDPATVADEPVADWFCVTNWSACSALVTPAFSRSLALRVVMGWKVSLSIRLISEPVTSTRSSCCG